MADTACGLGPCFALLVGLAGCEREPSSGAVSGAKAAIQRTAVAPPPMASEAPPPASASPPRARSGSPCSKTPSTGPSCEDGLECFETKIGGDAGVCAERFEVEPLLEHGKSLKGRWIGLRNRSVANAEFHCGAIACGRGVRCQPCAALLVLEDPYGKLFLLKNGTHLQCKNMQGGGLPPEPQRCDVARGKYSIVVGRLVDVGFRWAKLDATVLVKAPK